jgi:hypothetical protein
VSVFSKILVPGGVIAGVLGAVWFSSVVALGPPPSQFKASSKAEPAQQQQTQPKTPAPSAGDKKDQPPASKPERDCTKSDDRDCARRSAIATERQADSAWYGVWLVGLTLFVTIGAALVAVIAAMAAWRTLGTMQDTAERQLRAYIVVSCIVHNRGTDYVTLIVVNGGQTPAREVFADANWHPDDRYCGRVDHAPGANDPAGFDYHNKQGAPEYERKYFRERRAFSHGDTATVEFVIPNSIQAARTAGATVSLYGSVSYLTIYNRPEPQSSHFCYWLSPAGALTQCPVQNDMN